MSEQPIQPNPPAMPVIDTSRWTAAEWRKHEQQRGRLLVALEHHRRIGWSQEGLMGLLADMVGFTWQVARWDETPGPGATTAPAGREG